MQKKWHLFFMVVLFFHNSIRTAVLGSHVEIAAIALQSDGKIVAAGEVEVNDVDQIVLARYTSAGELDTSFGTNGVVTTLVGQKCEARAVAVQSDGKIIIAGQSDDAFLLVRYDTSGSADATFGIAGIVTTTIGEWSEINALAIQSDGKIVVAGASVVDDDLHFTLARYGTDGSIDTGFGTNGIVMTTVASRCQARAMMIQSDGKIIAGGWAFSTGGETFALVRYDTDGTLDATFGNSGIVTTGIGGYHDQINALAIQSDGKIVAGGVARMSAESSKSYRFALVRYGTMGSVDATFGSNGIVTTAIEGKAKIRDLAVQSDGKIIAVGYAGKMFAITRYSSVGVLDITFDYDGIMTARIGADCKLSSVVIQSDGKIIAAGVSDHDFALERINTDGSLDGTLGSEGIVSEPGGSNIPGGSITYIWDEKSTGTNGGAFSKDQWRTRDLNKMNGKIGNVSLSNNQFTLEPGFYEFYAEAPGHKVETHQARLYNVTDSKAEKYGSAAYAQTEIKGILTVSSIHHLLSLSKAKTFEIQHQCSDSQDKDGFGISAGFSGNKEVYTHVKIVHH